MKLRICSNLPVGYWMLSPLQGDYLKPKILNNRLWNMPPPSITPAPASCLGHMSLPWVCGSSQTLLHCHTPPPLRQNSVPAPPPALGNTLSLSWQQTGWPWARVIEENDRLLERQAGLREQQWKVKPEWETMAGSGA